jgi:uncharacterized protein YceK
MKHVIFVLLMAAILSGCASQSSLTPAMQADVANPIFCEGSIDCKTMWKRALLFINLNAGYKIVTAKAALIETGGAWGDNQSKKLSMRVTKSPRGGLRNQIKIEAWCQRGINIDQDCSPKADETLWRAQLFIREGIE